MQNIAFVLVLTGILLLYCEAIWIGRIYFGVMGSMLIAGGLSLPWRMPPSKAGLELVICSFLCFLVEARFCSKQIAGIAATCLLAGGAWQLGVAPALAIPVCAVFGTVTITLLAVAKKARQNKRADC